MARSAGDPSGKAERRSPWGALAERDFRNLYAGRALSLLGDALVPVALAFAVLDIDRSAAALGTVLAARTAALVLFLLVGGVVADRLPRRLVLIGSDVIRLVAHGTIAALILGREAEVWHLVVLSFMFGIGWAFFLPTSTGFIPETVSPRRLQQANALLAATYSAAQVLGPAIAGVLVVNLGPGWALAVDAATFLASAIFVGRIRAKALPHREPVSLITDLREGWKEFAARTWLWVDGVYSAVTAFAVLPALFAIGPIVADRSLDGAESWAIIVTAFGLGSVLGGAVLLRARPRRPLLAAVPPLMLLALPLLLLASTDATLAVAAGALAGGFGLTLFNTLFETTVQQHVAPPALSRVASIDWMLSQGLQPVGYGLVGPAVAAFGLRAPLIGSALWVLVTTLAVLSVPSVRRLERRDTVSGNMLEDMPIQRIDNVGIVVDDLATATAFFVELGLELEGEATVEGRWVDRIVGLDGVRSDIAMLRTPDGHGRLELTKFHTPPARNTDPNAPVNTLGIRRIMFAVDDIEDVLARLQAHGAELLGEVVQYEDKYRLCYVRGPEGIMIALAEQLS